MSDEAQVLAESHSEEAINAAANHAQAVEKARQAQLISAMESARKETAKIVEDVLLKVFTVGDNRADPEQMKILVRRIPILCTTIDQMHATLEEIKMMLKDDFVRKDIVLPIAKDVGDLKDNQKWVVRLVLGVVILALLGLVIVTKK